MELKAFYWKGDHLLLLDQRKLPREEIWLELRDHHQVAEAIKSMAVRGAPAIGAVAGYGFVLGIRTGEEPSKVRDILLKTRPTAVNLFWAVDRLYRAYEEGKDPEKVATAIEEEDYRANLKMGEIGSGLIKKGARILTHCNTGALATCGWGTALGVIRTAHREGKVSEVLVDETRPFLQGSRLTAWELHKEKIPYRVVTDSSAGLLMRKGMVDLIVVGADRITAGGFVANKIGTYSLSVLAKEHRIPFYVVAPSSTFDLGSYGEEDIVIEEREEEEILTCGGCEVAPEGARALNYAFDITPPENITGIITEKGLISPVKEENIRDVLGQP